MYMCISMSYAWTNVGKLERFEDKLRSLLTQFHYIFETRKFEGQGILFNLYLHVPEHHPDTNDVFFQRQDEAQVILLVHTHAHNLNWINIVKGSVLQVILEVVDQLR